MNGFTYNFPKVSGHFTDAQIAEKLREEVAEFSEAVDARDYDHALEELIDVLHVCETGLRQYALPQVWEKACMVERKNDRRGYYGKRLCFGQCEDGCPWWNEGHGKCDRFSEEG